MKKNKKGNGRPVHTNILKPSNVDIVNFPLTVEGRFTELLDKWLQVKGERLLPPKDLTPDMVLWRQLMVRYRTGDFRHTTDELNATRRIADWTHQVHCDLTNQPYTPLGLMEFV